MAPLQHISGFLGVMVALITLGGLGSRLEAARSVSEEADRDFSIPAGQALVTLRRFSEQSGYELLYSADAVEGVETRPVQGRLVPAAALAQLLHDTPLRAQRHAPTGAYAITRAARVSSAGTGAAGGSPAPAAPDEGTTLPAMKRNPSLLGLVRALVGLAVAAPAGAAATEPGSVSGRVMNAMTGQYLNNVRVVVRETKKVHFTDEFGAYRIVPLPSGPVVLDFFYSGLPARSVTVDVSPNAPTVRDVELGGVERAGETAVKLDPFVVATSRQMSAEMLAVNEQRFAPNLKNVVATDAFGEIAEGNVAEFLKYVPGVTINYEDSQANTISIRGLPDHMVNVSLDGAQLAGAAGMTTDTRAFEFKQVGIANISRVEVTKMPTPSTPADSLSGSVNMISRSAFEISRPEFSYRVLFNANSENLDVQRTPDSFEDRTYKILPGADFTYQVPLSRKFGFVVTGMTSNQFNEQHLSAFSYSAANFDGAPRVNDLPPRLQQYAVTDAPRRSHRHSGSGKIDWRVTPNSVLTLGGQIGLYESRVGEDRLTFNVGQNLAPLTAAGVRATFGPGYSTGASARGLVNTGGPHWYMEGETLAGNVGHRWDNGVWQTVAAVGASVSESTNANTQSGRAPRQVWARMSQVRVDFLEIADVRPGIIRVYDRNDREVDWRDMRNYELYQMDDLRRKVTDEVDTGSLSVRRDFADFGLPFALKAGAARTAQSRERRNVTHYWSYAGPDGRTNTIDSPAPYVSAVKTRDIGFGFGGFPWPSVQRAWDALAENPQLWVKTPANLVSEESSRILGSLYAKETVTATFLQAEGRLWRNRLHLLGGVRHEKTAVVGVGPLYDPEAVWLRTPEGNFARTPTGARIRRPEAGAPNSVEELRVVRKENAFRANRSYADYYPSLHSTFNVTDNLLFRASYAKTYGRPNYNEIIPNTTVREVDSGVDGGDTYGSIAVVNTGLKPWSAHNFDLSLEYYETGGGVFTAGVFRKEIGNFFGTQTRPATLDDLGELGLEERFEGWALTSKFNSGRARVDGAEFSVRQGLERFGAWGQGISVFVNGTKLWLHADAHEADFTNFIPEVLNWGASVRKRRLSAMAKWNYRGKARLENLDWLIGFVGGYRWDEPRTTLDVDLGYQLRRNLSLFATAKNLTDAPKVRTHSGPNVPAHARAYQTHYYGVQFTAGIRGLF